MQKFKAALQATLNTNHSEPYALFYIQSKPGFKSHIYLPKMWKCIFFVLECFQTKNPLQ